MTDTAWDTQLTARGVKLTPAIVKPGQTYWQLVEGKYLGEQGGKHHILVDVVDENNRRISGHNVRFWNGGSVRKMTESKLGEMYAVDFPMFAAGWSYGVAVDGLSDSVFGMGLGTVEQPTMGLHVSYHFVFQRTTAAVIQPPKPPTGPPVDLSLRDELLALRNAAAVLSRHIDLLLARYGGGVG